MEEFASSDLCCISAFNQTTSLSQSRVFSLTSTATGKGKGKGEDKPYPVRVKVVRLDQVIISTLEKSALRYAFAKGMCFFPPSHHFSATAMNDMRKEKVKRKR